MKIGIDIGGSHIGIGIIEKNNELLYKCEKDYSYCKEDMTKVVDTIIELIKETIKENNIDISKIESIGIASPGTVCGETIIKAQNLGIENLDISKEIKKIFDVPVYLQNDAKCAAIAEKKLGSLKQYNDAVFLTLGTGIGGAVFINGELLKPKRYSGFEIGHMVIEKDGKQCNCGRKGCFECYASMKKFKENIQKEFNLPNINGKSIKEFIIQNKENEKLENIINTYIDYLAIGIINLINIFEPEVISIGGSFAHYKEILLNRLEERIKKGEELFNQESAPKIIVAELKNNAGIIGATMI